MFKGDLGKSKKYVDEALNLGVDDSALRVDILLSLSTINWRQSDLDEAGIHLLEALNISQEIDDPPGVLRTLNILGIGLLIGTRQTKPGLFLTNKKY